MANNQKMRTESDLLGSVELPADVDEANASELDAAHLAGIDVALEFTTPDAAYGNIRACIDAGIPVVSGTTGWTNRGFIHPARLPPDFADDPFCQRDGRAARSILFLCVVNLFLRSSSAAKRVSIRWTTC